MLSRIGSGCSRFLGRAASTTGAATFSRRSIHGSGGRPYGARGLARAGTQAQARPRAVDGLLPNLYDRHMFQPPKKAVRPASGKLESTKVKATLFGDLRFERGPPPFPLSDISNTPTQAPANHHDALMLHG